MELTNNEKKMARAGAWLVVVELAAMALLLIYLFVLQEIFVPVRRYAMFVIFGLLGLSGILVAFYLPLMSRVRCPSCGFMILRNPKGMGPSDFQPHPSCKRIKGFNVWSYQIIRAVTKNRIMCIKCGQDFDLTGL